MKIARILYPVHALGPGERVAIWTYGCNHQCPGCANPELWQSEGQKEISNVELRKLLSDIKQRGRIDGVTITGGDPFLFPESLSELLSVVKEETEDILVYTGFLREELEKDSNKLRLLEEIAVLIDGPYVESENKGHVLKGSENQRIFYRKEQYRLEYEAYIQKYQGKQLVENFPAKNGVISVGIHKPDFIHELERKVGKRYE